MKAKVLIFAALCFAATARAQGDGSVSAVQQVLKEQGFYYGEITGRKDADTTAAIRRYQIRNGLQITGELNAETQQSLGVRPTAPPIPRGTPAPVAPAPPPRQAAPPDTSDLRDDAPVEEEERAFDAPDAPDASDLFAGTPFELAPPDVQTRVIVGAQSLLARGGYYRSEIDGVYGPGTAFALRAYQSRYGMEPSGRLDMETLASLGLLPGQREPGVTAAPRRRVERLRRPRIEIAPNGEPIYIPR